MFIKQSFNAFAFFILFGTVYRILPIPFAIGVSVALAFVFAFIGMDSPKVKEPSK